jgi:hypothetical protein
VSMPKNCEASASSAPMVLNKCSSISLTPRNVAMSRVQLKVGFVSRLRCFS